VVSVRIGTTQTVRIRLESDPRWDGVGPRPRHGLAVLCARTTDTDDRLLLAMPTGELIRFGIPGL